MQVNNDIISIQKKYLEILEAHFSSLWEKYEQSRLSPIRFLQETSLSDFSNHIAVVHAGKQWNTISFEADQLLNDISSFWATYQQPLQNALKSSDRLNTQIGDLNGMSSYYSNATIRLGLYFDSICLLDPVSIMAQRRETMDHYLSGDINDHQLTLVLLNYLEVRSLKSLLLSETDLPIAILVPPAGLAWGDSTFKQLEQIAKNNTNRLFAEAFNKQVESIGDLIEIFRGRSIQSIEKIFRKHDVLNSLFDAVGFKSLDDLIKFSSADTPATDRELSKLPLRVRNIPHIFGTIMGVFLALEGAETSASQYGIDLNIPKALWAFNRFKVKCNAELFAGHGVRAEIPIQAAIMSEKMDWMAAATVSDLVQLREKGVLEQVREIYRVNRRELQRASPEKLDEATAAVVKNVTESLQDCMNDVRNPKHGSALSWFKKVGLFVISGSLAVTSVFAPPLGAALIAGYSILAPGASATDLIMKYREDKKTQQELANRPIMHMLEIWDRGLGKEK